MYMDSGSGTQSDSYFSAVEQHRDYYSQSSSFVEKPVASGAAGPNCRWEVAPGAGEGSSEMFSLHSGLNVGVCGYLLNEPMEGLYMRRCKSLTVCAMLSGKFELSSTDKRRSEVVGRGDVWISAGEEGEARCVEPSGEFISGVGVELPATMLDTWFGAASCELTRSLEQTLEEREKCGGHVLKGAFPKVRSLPDSHPLIMSAKRLLMIERDTVCGRLAFESCALDFLSQALMLNTPVNGEYPMGSSRKKAVEEAVCILNDEWGYASDHHRSFASDRHQRVLPQERFPPADRDDHRGVRAQAQDGKGPGTHRVGPFLRPPDGHVCGLLQPQPFQQGLQAVPRPVAVGLPVQGVVFSRHPSPRGDSSRSRWSFSRSGWK